MFKTRNNQPTLANQQPLDEIELISGQEMVELSCQELMNVVGGKAGDKAGDSEEPNLLGVDLPGGNRVVAGHAPQSEAEVDLNNSNPTVVVRPGGTN